MHFENQKHYRRNLGRIKGLSKGLSRKVQGSRNWWKKSKKLAQATTDASFFEVKRQLLYKSEQYGGNVQLVDRWYASSKTCHACGWVEDDLMLADRTFVCEQCGVVLDRDFNASLNIRDETIRLIQEVPVVASSG
jgi:transposase